MMAVLLSMKVKLLFNPLAELKAYNFYEEKVAHIIGI